MNKYDDVAKKKTACFSIMSCEFGSVCVKGKKRKV